MGLIHGLKDFIKLQSTIWEFPLGRRIGAYILIWTIALLALISAGILVYVVWALLSTDMISNILDNEPVEQYDIR